MTIASGINKVVAYKKESVWGEVAGPTGAKVVRRVSANFNLNKETYSSEEIRTDYQMSDFRHGVRSVEGSINGELSAGSYSDFIGSALARDFAAGATAAGVALAATATAPQFVRTTGSWIAQGFKIGDVVRFTGFTATANNNKNFLIVALTATQMTVVALDGSSVVAEPTATVSVSVAGKKTYVPTTGHTDDSYTVEEYYRDIGQSEVTTGNKVNTVGIQLPASGLSTIDIAFMGKDRALTGTTQYFTAPAAQGEGGIFAAVNGALLINGMPVALVTSLSVNINRNLTMEPVVGQNTHPDIFEGRCVVDGEFSYQFTDGDLRDAFDNEEELSLVVALTTSELPNADFITVVLPRIKINGSGRDDGDKGIVASAPFQALKASAGSAFEITTIQIQDSAA